MSVACPQGEECGSLESKFITIWRLAKAIQEAFKGVSAKHSLIVLAFALR
jgi:hypothetical protein